MLKKAIAALVIASCFTSGILYTVGVKSDEDDLKVMKCDIDDIKKLTSIHTITSDLSPNYASRITNAKPEMIILYHTISNTAVVQ